MARRGGVFGRIATGLARGVERALRPIERFLEGQEPPPRREPPRPTPPPRGAPPRRPGPTQGPRRRPPRQLAPGYREWQRQTRRFRTQDGRRPEYQDNRDFVDDMVSSMNIPTDDKEAFWRDYIKYMVKGQGRYRRNDTRNKFWRTWGIRPKDFDWWAWREAMGYSHGNRSR